MRMTFLVVLVAVSAAVVGPAVAAPSSSAASQAYWSESKAETLVVRKVKIPYCRIWPEDSECPDGTMRSGRTPVIKADCTGASEYKATFRYNRFTCKIVTYNHNAHGRIAVYVTGRLTFRWKILGSMIRD
jgi:hypothetical protein